MLEAYGRDGLSLDTFAKRLAEIRSGARSFWQEGFRKACSED